MAKGSVKDITKKAELDAAKSEANPVVLHFWAPWCAASEQMDAVFAQLSTDTPQAQFFRVEAEELPEISEEYGVSVVPFFVFLKDGKLVDKLEGVNPAELAHKVAKLAGSPSLVGPAAPASLGMSGAPSVLEAVAKLAQTNGVSGCNSAIAPALNENLKNRLEKLVNSSSVILFMKGTKEEPQCGFSRKVVTMLKEEGVDFATFNILDDEEVRQGLKTYSNWPTFPQLYCKGELVGGCDIVLEMHKSGELRELFSEKGVCQKDGIEDRLKKLINSSRTMLFMKGSPDQPRCGFSSKVVTALKEIGAEFGSFDILSDEEVRQGLKSYSNWPTFPQLYHNGELLGGCDIVLELQKNGELKSTLSE